MLCLFVSSYACWCSAGLNWELSVFLPQGERETRENRLASSRRSLQRQSVELGETDGEYGAILDWDLIVFWNCVGEEAGRAQRDGQLEGECCAFLFLVMCVGKV